MYYLYFLTENDKVQYVGVTKQPTVRKRNHRNTLPPHEFIVKEEFSDLEQLNAREEELIAEYDTYRNGWNKHPGGNYDPNCSAPGAPPGRRPWNADLAGTGD